MSELVRSVWGEPRPAGAPGPRWWDWGLVAALMVAALIEGVVRGAPAVTVVAVVGLAPALLWRRSHPLLMVAITFGACALAPLLVGAELELNTLAYLLLFPYALFRWGSGREAVLGAAILLGKLGLSWGLGYLATGEVGAGVIVLTAVGASGVAMRYRAGARARELDQVKLLERERLARDLHDTVAHHVSAMAIRAQAGLATMAAQPDAPAEALRVIEAEASRTLAEMRTMVRALRREQPAELAPNPGIGELRRLADPGGDGPLVAVEVSGPVDGIPDSVGAAIYRLAQESVTNARRHARHATRVEVLVLVDDTSVRLRVSDDGDGAAGRTPAPGYGLVGMIERADLLGGTCEAGPSPGRGWTVTAVLPRSGAPA